MDLKAFFRQQKKAVHQGCLSVYSRIPPDSLDFRPHADMLTLGQIIRHVWVSEQGVCRLALYGDFGYHDKRVPGGLPAVLGDPVTSLDAELKELERTHQTTLEEAEAFPLEGWDEERSNVDLNMRRKVSVLLFGINEHHIHHRAQASTYLRLLTGTRISAYAL